MDFEQDEAIVVSTSTMKYGKGASTGIYFRFHSSAEYTNLTHPKRHQLKAWRITPERRAAVKLKCKGNINFTLQKHCNNYQHDFVQMQASSTHVAYQLPN